MFNWFKKDKKKEEEVKEVQQAVEQDAPDDNQLEKEGFDPDKIPEEEVKDEVLTDFNEADYPGYLTVKAEEIFKIVENYQYQKADGDARDPLGHKKGGRICADKTIQKKLRGIGKEVIKQIGKKIISGSLNLTTISFPIKSMIPKTALETAVHQTCLFPILLNKASMQKDPLERLKLVITATLSSFFFTNTFLKPLNPILGETLTGYFNDGTQVYCEQTSHHPPVSYFLIIGPNKSYRYYGYYCYDAKAGLNSLTILNKGKRWVEFPDGQKIEYNFPNELYSGTFMGTLKQESIGGIKYQDQKYGFKAEVLLGKVKKRPSDYFKGQITDGQGKPLVEANGTYLGYIDFDQTRYWDYKNFVPCRIYFQDPKQALESDHQKRSDLVTLKQGQVAQAQQQKEILEDLQRKDRKLREEFEKKQKKK